MALRFVMLMFAAYLGAVACQKDRAVSTGAKDGIGAGAPSKADVARANDEAMSATDKSGVDEDHPADDSAEAEDTEEE